MNEMKNSEKCAWVTSTEMGLGHQRAAYALRDLYAGRVVSADSPEVSSEEERKQWEKMRNVYETFSRLNDLPFIGGAFFGLMDRFQEINPYYPFRDLSFPTPQVKYLKKLIDNGLCGCLSKLVKESGLPSVSTFYAISIALDANQCENVYLVATDADLNRVWVSSDPKTSKIQYFAPCSYTLNRLKEYGIPDEKIWVTGFPLPKENLGSTDLEILRADLAQRLYRLDPNNRFWSLHRVEAEHYLGLENCSFDTDRRLNVTFAVGGAGAQKEIGISALRSLKWKILSRDVRLNLVAGIRSEVRDYFLDEVAELGLTEMLGDGVYVLYEETLDKYFASFNQLLRKTDVLWTKPSELSFYSGLGLPILMSQPLGAHEHINRKWLMEINAGLDQNDPSHCNEWLFDLLNEGRLAEAAWDGFLKARKCGTFKIEEIIKTGKMEYNRSPLLR